MIDLLVCSVCSGDCADANPLVPVCGLVIMTDNLRELRDILSSRPKAGSYARALTIARACFFKDSVALDLCNAWHDDRLDKAERFRQAVLPGSSLEVAVINGVAVSEVWMPNTHPSRGRSASETTSRLLASLAVLIDAHD